MASYAKFDVWQNTAGENYGTVLQVKSYQLTTTVATTVTIDSGGYASGLAVNITPKYATSKILIFGHLVSGYTNGYTATYYKLKRTISGNTVEVGNGTPSGSRPGVIARSYAADNEVCLTDSYAYLDSPSTVSAITYQIYVGSQNASYYVLMNRTANDTNNAGTGARGSSSITVMEIAQ